MVTTQMKTRSAEGTVLAPKKPSATSSAGAAEAYSRERKARIVLAITATLELMRGEMSSMALEMFADDLLGLTDEQILEALNRARREVRGTKLTPQDVLARAGVVSVAEGETLDAVAAWDEVERVVARFGRFDSSGEVVLRPCYSKADKGCEACHGEGRFIISEYSEMYKRDTNQLVDCSCRQREDPPDLGPRVLDSLKRIGGWTAVRDIRASTYPFIRRDFITEYERWTKVETRKGPGSVGLVAIGHGAGEGTKGGSSTEQLLERILLAK